MYIFIFDSYSHSNIKSYQPNQIRSTTLRIFIGRQFFFFFFEILCQQSIRFLFFNITTTCTTYYYTITHIKLMNYYWPLCQRSNLNSFRINVLYISFVDRCFSFCTCSFRHCVVCSLICGFWLPLLYLQTLIRKVIELLTISSANIWKLSGLELIDILIQHVE
jgi:hypothetical protein